MSMLLPRRLCQLAFAQTPQKQYSPPSMNYLPLNKGPSNLLLNCIIFLSFVTTRRYFLCMQASSNFSHCWMFVSVSHHCRPHRALHSKVGRKAWLSFQHVLCELFRCKPWAAEFWVSFHRTNPSKCSTGSTASSPPQSLQATQNRQKIKMHCQAFFF